MSAAVAKSDRQYHDTSSAYVLPNDTVEQNRLDAQAAAIVTMVGGKGPALVSSHLLSNARKMADIGCGTGVATIQLAGMVPSAQVFGVDISVVPNATKALASKNITWVKANILDSQRKPGAPGRDDATGLTQLQGLDYLFGRMLFLGINDWPHYFETCASLLEPGGTIEHQDLDWAFYRAGTDVCLSTDWEWHRAVLDACKKTGLSTSAGSSAARHMADAGLKVISTQNFEFSFVPSAKTPDSQAMGRYVQATLMPQYPELMRKMLSAIGIEGSELERLTRECLRDLSSEEGIHQKYTVTIGKKY
ncbi:S-adenosyl-L-methionine-dependent methyltransferase [Astrocystis sublimbata]|nr:S-adenosyl-L-methionine-dependent methyltransferase [Astrocystis sublimbata]